MKNFIAGFLSAFAIGVATVVVAGSLRVEYPPVKIFLPPTTIGVREGDSYSCSNTYAVAKASGTSEVVFSRTVPAGITSLTLELSATEK